MLKRRVLENVNFVLGSDPAVNMASEAYETYRDTLDYGSLKFHEGQEPTVFVIKQLTLRQRMLVHQEQDLFKKSYLSTRFGLVEIQNYEHEPIERKPYGEYGEIITDECMDKLGLITEELLNIGSVILKMSEVRDPLS